MILILFDIGKLKTAHPELPAKTRTVCSVLALVFNRGDRRCFIGYEAESFGDVAKHGFHFLFFRFAIIRNGDMYSWM